MKAYTNTDIVESRTKWAKRIAPLTMLLLLGGLILNFISINQPQYFQYAVILLVAGFIMSMVSSNLVNNWIREPRADQTLVATLKKFGNDFILFNYTSVASHILLTPSRLYVIIIRRQDGEISVRGSRFYRKFSFARLLRFFVDEGLGAPTSEAESKISKLEKELEAELSEEEIPEIQAFVLFTNKDVELNRQDPALPVLTTSELKLYLREHDKQKNIPAALRKQLVEILSDGYQAAR